MRWWIAAAVFALDRVMKVLSFRLPENGIILIPGVVRLRLVRNEGIAFSLLSGRPWLLGAASLIIILGACWFLRGKQLSKLAAVGVMMMLGGAAGNMVDRFFLGYVPDMIEMLFVDFAIFNAADVFLTVGCAVVIIHLLLRKEQNGESSGKPGHQGCR